MKKRTLIAILGVVFIASAAYVGWTKFFEKNFYVVKPDWAEAIEPVELKDPNRHNASIAGAMEYLNSKRADLKTGVVNMEDVYAVQEQLAKMPRGKQGSWLQWDELGPDDVGGRTRAIVIDKDNQNKIYAGGVSGGFWISENGGATWIRGGGDNTTDNTNLNIVSMTQAANGDIYYGTGENGYLFTNGEGNSGFYGRGVFKSTDKGKTFTHLSATDPANPWNGSSEWQNVHKLVADPTNPNRIYAGNDKGLYITDDGGATWTIANIATPPAFRYCTDLVVSPDGKTIFAAIMATPKFQRFQLWRSTDGGNSFSQVGTSTLPLSSSSYRVAISKSNPNTVYLSTCAQNYTYDAMYRSDDNGTSWVMIAEGDGSYFNPVAAQGYYDHCVVVDPKNNDRVFVAGLNIWEGKKVSGKWQFKQLTSSQSEFYSNGVRIPYYVHADQHIMTFDNQENPVMYIGSDGGVSKSTDITYTASPTFYNADYGYNTVQFYAIGVSAYNREEVVGGTQDNGTILVNQAGVTLRNSSDIRGGDGGYSEISKINPNVYFSEYIQGDIRRSFNKGKGDSWSSFFDVNIPAPGPNYPFITTYTLWESLNDPTSVDSVIFSDEIAAHKAGETVQINSPNGYVFEYVLPKDLAKGEQLLVQDKTQSKLIIGANNAIWMTREALIPGSKTKPLYDTLYHPKTGDTVTEVSTSPEFFKIANIPGFVTHSIRVTPDGNTAFVAGEEGGSAAVYRITGLSGKIYRYKWKFIIDQIGVDTTYKLYQIPNTFYPDSIDITTTRIFSRPGQAATGVAFDENNPSHLIVTLGSYGYPSHVFRTKNALASTIPSFTDITSNLPSFPVYDGFINPNKPSQYVIATEAGIWASQDEGATWAEENNGMERVPTFHLRSMNFGDKPWIGPVLYAGTHGRGVFMTTTIETGIRPSKSEESTKIDVALYPNPVISQSNVTVHLEKASAVQISVFDIQGKVVYNMNYPNQTAGDHIYKIDASSYKPGTYFVKVKTAKGESTAKMLKMH